jgi:PAS domain S-box-containing protein
LPDIQPPVTGAGPPAAGPAPARQDGLRAALGLVGGDSARARQDRRRVTLGIVVLIALGFVGLNVGVYQNASTRLVRERWAQLESATAEKRADVLAATATLQRNAEYLAAGEEVRTLLLSPGTGADAARRALERAVRSFELEAVAVVEPGGSILAGTSAGVTSPDESLRDLVHRVAGRTAGSEVAVTRLVSRAVMVVAAPVPGLAVEGGRPVLLLYAGFDRHLTPRLSHRAPFGGRSGFFLVAREDAHVAILTPVPGGGTRPGRTRFALNDPDAAAAALAAQGAEARLESEAAGNAVWSVTATIEPLRCGLVGQADRSAMLAGTRSVLVALFIFDLGILLLAGLAAGHWRRQNREREQRRAAERTRRQAERIRAVLDNAFDAIVSFDRGGSILTANRAAERLFGCGAQELEGQPLERFLPWRAADGDAPGIAFEMVSRAQVTRADGAALPVEFSLASSGETDALLYTAVVRDISERVEAERQIRAFAEGLEVSNRRLEEANAQLEQASRLKSEFLANTSHELRTPLNGMLGFLQLVLDGMCETEEEEREFLQQALQCSRNLLGLINDVLDIAKIEAGKLSLHIEPVDLRMVFDEVYTVTHVQAQQRGIALTFLPPPEGAMPCRGDFGKIKQVVINLVGNSLKFTPTGSITVRAQERADLGHSMIEVIDTGIGIPPDRQGLIFEKFTQADGSTTRRYGGTGLGLAITRNLVELMGGVIGVDSEGEGRGTRMYFSLPLWRGDDDALPVGQADCAGELVAGPAGGPLVLVVEDDSVFRRMTVAVLHQSGYRTIEAASAETAWMLIRRFRPAIVVLDFALSCSDGAALRSGWDLAERMAGDDRARAIPLIFVTGFEEQVRQRLRSGLLAHQPQTLSKPVDPQALLQRIETMLGRPERTIRVLLADDDPTVSAYLGRVLPEDRFHLVVAVNGDECLHLLRTQPQAFDLVLLDLMMPEVSGYDVLREMTLGGTAAGLPVIILTNEPDARNEDERRLLEQGLVLEVVAKSAIHENPRLLPRVIEGQLDSIDQVLSQRNQPRLDVERFPPHLPEAGSGAGAELPVERFERTRPRLRPVSEAGPPDDEGRRAA